MTDDQITALAREYAEFTDMSPVDKKNNGLDDIFGDEED